MRTIIISALNIVLPEPHRSERYRELWLAAYASQRPVRLRGDTGGMVRYANMPQGEEGFIWGDFLKFTNIDANRNWLNLATQESLRPEVVERDVVIPSTYRPNLHSVPYLFFPKKHRLLFMSRYDQKNTFAPSMAKILVEKFLTRPDLVEIHGEATVTIEPDRETLETIFSLPTLREIRLEITPPNALGNMERKLLRYLADQNATRYTQELGTSDPEGLVLSQETKQAAEVAQSNGYVAARGVDKNGMVVKLSTVDHPFQQKLEYDPNVTNAGDLFEEVAGGILRDLSTATKRRK